MNTHVKFSHKLKAFFVAVVVLSCLGFLAVRLYTLQILHHAFYIEKAESQHLLNLKKPARRGRILDRKMREFAITVPAKSLYAVPYEISEVSRTTEKLSQVLGLKKRKLRKKLVSKKKFVWVKRKLGSNEIKSIESLNLDGIHFRDETRRAYPGGMLLSHVLGFTNIDDQGLEGIELYYDKYLSGKPGWSVGERDGKRREVVPMRHQSVTAQDGMSVVLTIDMAVQTMVEKQLDLLWERFTPKSASIIVIEPRTGEIVAMANWPNFDPNSPAKYPAAHRRNRIVTDTFEPGSTFKPFIVAAALNENILSLEDRFFCENGTYRMGSRTLHDTHAYGDLSVQEILERSSNIGMSKVGLSLSRKTIYKYIRDFGFGYSTDVGLTGEVNGIVHPIQRWSKLSVASLSMGQEIAVTALQLARAYCAFANGGYLVKPKIIKEIIGKDGRVIIRDDILEPKQIISLKVSKSIAKALTGVVSERGTAPKAALNGYAVAGKTGTAQKADPGGGYSHTKYIASFIGFLPVRDPQAVILVVVNEPNGAHYGGTVAAPFFKEVAANLMHYLEIPPDAILAKDTEE